MSQPIGSYGTGAGAWRRHGFTLIELLVVVSIIALLISILLPSLRRARENAKAVVCATNTRHIGQAMASYLVWSKAVFPPSYAYPHNYKGEWAPEDQPVDKDFGYLHWSWFLYEGGQAEKKSFQCPAFDKGGAPRTNPGPDPKDWNDRQQDDQGDGPPPTPTSIEDKQAPRMAYTGNAALISRNKYTPDISPGPRQNKFVKADKVPRQSDTILFTEFVNKWQLLAQKGTDRWLSKSHRPINVFYHVGTGWNEFGSVQPGFYYGTTQDQENYGVVPYQRVLTQFTDLLGENKPTVNAVGRHHPGGDGVMGGTANFLFMDGHSERMHVVKSLEERRWGDKFYSVTGDNRVLNADKWYHNR